MEIASDRRYEFDLTPAELWAEATQVESYRTWWPWLRRLDGASFEPGARWHCSVQPPLPYRVRFSVQIDEVQPHSLLRASVGGDIRGHARLEVSATPTGCQARLVSELAPRQGVLQAMALLARPLARFGHDWVLDHGARQFSEAVHTTVDTDPSV